MSDTWPKHVWVDVTGRWAADQRPGLLVEWRRAADGSWEGYVIAADMHRTPRGEGTVQVYQGWHPAEQIRPAVP